FFPPSRPSRDLHPFPTRRSSDLIPVPELFEPIREWRYELPDFLSKRFESRPPGFLHGALGDDECTLPVIATVEQNDDMSGRKTRSEEHTSELQSPYDLVCRLLLE